MTEKVLSEKDPVHKMKNWYEKNKKQLSELSVLVRGKLSRIQRRVIGALVTSDVHNRDIGILLIIMKYSGRIA